MSVIYSFLQKRRMHESQHGFVMVFIAYLLSALMLILGSDVFYNINSAAAGLDEGTKEKKQSSINADLDYIQSEEFAEEVSATELMNPYGLKEAASKVTKIKTSAPSSTSGDTVWLFGDSMDGATFDSIMVQMSKNYDFADAKEDKDGEIISTSVEDLAGTLYDSISSKEVKMLERIVQAEAGGEDIIGKILIVNVIMNRVEDEHFPDTIKDVIFQKKGGDYQFSPVGSGRYYDVSISKETKKAVQRALKGEDYSKGALYFVARDKTDSDSIEWFDDRLDWLFEHGGHEFYKNK